MIKKLNLFDYFNLLPPVYHGQAYIAGGAAVDYVNAGDVDLWVLFPEEKLQPSRDTFLTQIQEYLDTVVNNNPKIMPLAVEPFAASATDLEDSPKFTMHMVGHISYGKGVDVMYCQFKNVFELLKSFDLSVHQKAVSANGGRYRVKTSTDLDEEICVTRWDTPIATQRRLLKLMERYSLPADRKTLKKLEALVAELTEQEQ